ncbi:hypothetical protein AB0D12_31855 [Streptomyces sp. NPDC048479]|uniref:hypothetical protein n=1 Tax=Streptomyces sp. NPDC048479 TaxID=3154725 RepID=UPI0034156CBE
MNPEPTPTPRVATPEEVSAMLRSADTSPEAPYPCQIGVYCDGCGTVVKRDFIVSDLMPKPERLDIARAALRAEGWQCDDEGDYCPICAAAGDPVTAVAPNPYSPYADASPQRRHIFLTSSFFGDPKPGVLTPTGCERLAVVPEEPMRDANSGDGILPHGLCPACLAEMRGEELPEGVQPVADCRACGSSTDHDGMCALCRQEAHDDWWPHRDQDATPQALEQILGPKLAGHLTNDMHRAETRIVYDLIATRESAYTARAWLIGQNPNLGDRSPIAAIIAGDRHDVLEAARAYVEVTA